MHGTHRSRRNMPQLQAARERAYSIPLDEVRSRRSRAVSLRYALAVFRAAAPGRPGALLQRQRVRAVLVGDQLQRHHGRRNQPRGLSPRRSALGGITIRDAAVDFAPARASSRWISRRHSAQRKTVAPMFTPTHLDQLAITIRERAGRMPRRAAAQRDLRLGRPGLDRTDHPDAGDAVRFSLGGPPQADALVRRCDHRCRPTPRRPRLKRQAELIECGDYFAQLWKERVNAAAEEATCCR